MATIVFVCTGNLCRSVVAANLASSIFRDGADPVSITSAGMTAGGRSAPPETVKILAEKGVDLIGHKSRRFEDLKSPSADLILTMERDQTRKLIDREPQLFSRTFTLREFARRGGQAGPRRKDETISSYVYRVAADRRMQDLARMDGNDDTPDPYGKSLRQHRKSASEIEQLLLQISRVLFPSSA